MEISAQDAKAALRAEVRKRLKQCPPGQRQAASSNLCALLAEQTLWKEARCLLLFAPLPDEPDIWPMLEAALGDGKVVGLPRFDGVGKDYIACRVQDPATELKPGKLGIREPMEHCERLPLKQLDLILVPGVAFDLRGGRLGRGKGFFDRLLAAASGTSCGVAFEEQIVGEIPVAAHDIRVNRILTPTRWIEL